MDCNNLRWSHLLQHNNFGWAIIAGLESDTHSLSRELKTAKGGEDTRLLPSSPLLAINTGQLCGCDGIVLKSVKDQMSNRPGNSALMNGRCWNILKQTIHDHLRKRRVIKDISWGEF